MNKTIDTLKKHNRIILFIFAAIEIITGLFSFSTVVAVSYTHLDVYKRQAQNAVYIYCCSLIPSNLSDTKGKRGHPI